MTLRMGDGVTASNLPGGLEAYAGYVNGLYANFGTIAAQHPGAHLLPISVWLANVGDCLDIENGDASPNQAPQFVQWRSAAGVRRPVLYASISVMPQVVAALDGAGIGRAAYRLWAAHYTNSPHICGHGCGYPTVVDGTQWTDHNNAWDESLLAADFFGGAPTPPPPAPTTNRAAALLL